MFFPWLSMKLDKAIVQRRLELPRKAKKLAAEGGQKGEGAKSLREGVVSMAQKAMMEEERERVIRLYRDMKKGKTSA